MKSISLNDWIRQESNLMGITLSDADVLVLRQKWESDPLVRMRDLLSGLRVLKDRFTPLPLITQKHFTAKIEDD